MAGVLFAVATTGTGVTDWLAHGHLSPDLAYLSTTLQRPEQSQAELGLRRAPAFTPEVTSGSPVLSGAQTPPWKKEGKAEAGKGCPSHWMRLS